jgi:hypothetical protein
MSNLVVEKIAKLREFGLGEKSDSELHDLLRRAGFNVDRAINQFFEEKVRAVLLKYFFLILIVIKFVNYLN